MKKEKDPTAEVVGRIFLEKLGIKTPKEISYKSGIGATISLTESEAKSRRYEDAKAAAIEKAESLIEDMCADIALPSFRLGVYDNALAAMDGQGALEVSLCGFAGVSKGKLDALAEGIQARLDAMCPEIGWEIIRRADRSTGNVAVLELQLSHTKPYIEEDA